ncbi:hypothetical protein FH972_026606 [Carpinus fangiana]|uniref:Uncharacterized protein n=1 Tax=Carpinus fangiana TaxID=176857 RepID=A0A5N6L4S7_9ROSI|nr:hypothetical protein FH972_026606 [Carpinus fangiana]
MRQPQALPLTPDPQWESRAVTRQMEGMEVLVTGTHPPDQDSKRCRTACKTSVSNSRTSAKQFRNSFRQAEMISRLCQAIVDLDFDSVRSYCDQKDLDVNQRDCTGRFPLHLALVSSSLAIVQHLLENGADIGARSEDGKAALHLAARRGEVEFITAILQTREKTTKEMHRKSAGAVDVNILSLNEQASPLQYAIAYGHPDLVRTLVQDFGADLSLPIEFKNEDCIPSVRPLFNLVLASRLPKAEAEPMLELLLDLGASPAQSDDRQTSVLHRIVDERPKFLSTLFKKRRSDALEVINAVVLSHDGYQFVWRTPLTTAMANSDMPTAQFLLANGAQSLLNQSQFIDVFQSGFPEEFQVGLDTNKVERIFQEHLDQPIVTTLGMELPELIRPLVDTGATPNSINVDAWRVINDESARSGSYTDSVLDIVQRKIDSLSRFMDSDTHTMLPSFKPSVSSTLSQVTWADSYQSFVAQQSFQDQQKRYQTGFERYERNLEKSEHVSYIAKRHEARRLLAEFRSAEHLLLSRNAKKFSEIYPEKPRGSRKREDSGVHVEDKDIADASNVAYDWPFDDPNPENKAAYEALFEAAWKGDIDTIRSYTQDFWGEGRQHPPLRITMRDCLALTPFSIALLRGHNQVAESILEIAVLKLRGPDSEATTEQDMDPFYLLASKIPIGRLSEHFHGRKYQLDQAWGEYKECQSSGTLLQYSICVDDHNLLEFMLDHFSNLSRSGYPEEGTEFSPPSAKDLWLAVQLGRTDMIDRLITKLGLGLPLDILVNNSCNSEQGVVVQSVSNHDLKADPIAQLLFDKCKSPLLRAVRTGTLEVVKWFMGPSPLACYTEYVTFHMPNNKIQHLTRSPDEIIPHIKAWLDLRADLVIHCAVLHQLGPTEGSPILAHLLKAVPESVNSRSPYGEHTPLQIAFSLRQPDFARVLIQAGADHRCRDKRGHNIIHTLASPMDDRWSTNDAANELLALLDPQDRRLLFAQRRHGGRTQHLPPIANWLDKQRGLYEIDARDHADELKAKIKLLRDLLVCSEGMESRVYNSSGDLLLHTAVRHNMAAFVEVILDFDPSLLWCENVAGKTPYELIEQRWYAWRLAKPARLQFGGDSLTNYEDYYADRPQYVPLIKRPVEEFGDEASKWAPSARAEAECFAAHGRRHAQNFLWDEITYNVCRSAAIKQKNPEAKKRRLVLSSDVDEVATLLAEEQQAASLHVTRGFMNDEVEEFYGGWWYPRIWIKEPFIPVS